MNSGLLVVFLISIFFALSLRLWSRVRLGDALTAAIMFVPAFFYWLDGKPLEELSGGADGITLKLRAASTLPISELTLDLNAVSVRHDPDAPMDNRTAAFWEQCGDYITIRSGDLPSDGARRDNYIVTLALAIRASMLCGRLIGVVVVDERERYIGSYETAFFAELAALWAVAGTGEPPSASDLASLFSSHTMFGTSLQFPERRLQSGEGFVAAINREAPVATALERFSRTDASFLALTDEQGVLTGLLPRTRVVEAILIALAARSPRTAPSGD